MTRSNKQSAIDMIARLCRGLEKPNPAKPTMRLAELKQLESQLRAEERALLLAEFERDLPEFARRYAITLDGYVDMGPASAWSHARQWTVTSWQGNSGWTYGAYWTKAEAERVMAVLAECSAERHKTGDFATRWIIKEEEGLIDDFDLRQVGLMAETTERNKRMED